jgi:hypothetical protein
MEISGEQIAQLREAIGTEASGALLDHDCIRFLRARNGNVTKAAAMATTWFEWWHTSLSGHNPNDLTPATILTQIVDHWEPTITEFCPHAFEGFDKMGRPIYWVSPTNSTSCWLTSGLSCWLSC